MRFHRFYRQRVPQKNHNHQCLRPHHHYTNLLTISVLYLHQASHPPRQSTYSIPSNRANENLQDKRRARDKSVHTSYYRRNPFHSSYTRQQHPLPRPNCNSGRIRHKSLLYPHSNSYSPFQNSSFPPSKLDCQFLRSCKHARLENQ